MNRRLIVLGAGVLAASTSLSGARMSEPVQPKGTRILVHVATGPENATRAALAFLVARTALEEGHAVTLFLAGDAVQLIRDATLDALSGTGTGSLREHYAVLAKAGVKIYASGMSSKARGVTDADLKGKTVEFAAPNVLVRLAIEHDRVFTY
jgi:predicted peroxiredoxin